MTLRKFEDWQPRIASSAYVDEAALVVGNVEIDDNASIWPLCVVRGDVQSIRIGKRTNLQDGTIIHVTHDSRYRPGGLATYIGDDVTVGHRVILHACTIENSILIGMGAIVMDAAIVRSQVIVGAGSVVPPGKVLESGYLYVGSPVVRKRPLTDEELEFLDYSARHYVRLKERHQRS